MGSTRAAAQRGWLLTVLLTMLFMYQADAAIVNVATPSIRTDLGASGAQLELVISGYLLASATLIITGARLGYLHGCRRVFLAGLAIFGVASLACGLAPDPGVLIAARVLQGVGGALAYPQVLTSIQVYFREGAVRARALSLYSVALAGGAVAGQIPRWAARLRRPARGRVAAGLPHQRPGHARGVAGRCPLLPRGGAIDGSKRLDVPGAITLSAAVLLVIVPLTLGREAGWPAWAWTCLAASLPVGWSFVIIERSRTAGGRSPLIDLRVIRRRPIAWRLWPQALGLTTAATPRHAADISGAFTTSLQIAGAVSVAAFGSLFLSQFAHPGAVQASHAFGVVTAVFALVALIASPIAYRATHATPKRVTSASVTAAGQPVGWSHGNGDRPARGAGTAGDRAGERIGPGLPGDGQREGARAVRRHSHVR
jgi:MFS family permease